MVHDMVRVDSATDFDVRPDQVCIEWVIRDDLDRKRRAAVDRNAMEIARALKGLLIKVPVNLMYPVFEAPAPNRGPGRSGHQLLGQRVANTVASGS